MLSSVFERPLMMKTTSRNERAIIFDVMYTSKMKAWVMQIAVTNTCMQDVLDNVSCKKHAAGDPGNNVANNKQSC